MEYSYQKSGIKAIAPAVGAVVGMKLAYFLDIDPTLGATFATALVVALWDFLKRKVIKL